MGAKLAHGMQLPQVVFEMDSQVIVVNIINMCGSHSLFLCPLFEKVLNLLEQSDWSCSVVHTSGEANRCADFQANLGLLGSFTWTVLDVVPPSLNLIVAEDAIVGKCYHNFPPLLTQNEHFSENVK